jgi:hypothetical protein
MALLGLVESQGERRKRVIRVVTGRHLFEHETSRSSCFGPSYSPRW